MLYLQIFRDLSKSIRPHLQREDSSVSGEFWGTLGIARDLRHLSPWNLACQWIIPLFLDDVPPISAIFIHFPMSNWDFQVPTETYWDYVKAFGILIPPHHPRDGHAKQKVTNFAAPYFGLGSLHIIFFPVLAVFYCKTRSSSLFDSGSEEIPYIYIYILMIQNPMTSNDILSLEPPRKPETSFVVWPSVFFFVRASRRICPTNWLASLCSKLLILVNLQSM